MPLFHFVQALRSSSATSVRLACIRHAASVHPEPGSNSQFEKFEVYSSSSWLIRKLIIRLLLVRIDFAICLFTLFKIKLQHYLLVMVLFSFQSTISNA